MRRRLACIMRKEFIHIGRDWRTLVIIVLYPIVMIVLFGYAITLDMRNIRFAVIDESRTPESRELLGEFSRNRFFVQIESRPSLAEVERLFRRREASMVVVIPEDFSRSLAERPLTVVQLLIDASDANTATFIGNYSSAVLRIFNERRGFGGAAVMSLQPRVLYNPDMKSSNFFVPGLVALILLLISALLTSIAMTREKETGTMEQILVSPIHPFEIVVGKVLPYITLGLVNGAFILVFSTILFNVPIRGSLALLAALSLLYIFVALSFGLMISTVARTQQVAMLMTLMATILPTIMLSGFIFPIASMPVVLRWISEVVPATHYLIIIRALMLKGVGVQELGVHILVLTALGAVTIAASIRRFKMTLE